MSELKRCPFCGGEGEVHEYNSFWYKVGCNNQKCFLYITASVFNSKEEAIEAWNTRKPMQNIVERLENRIKYCELCHEEFNDSRMSLTYEVQLNSYKNAIEIVKEEGGGIV